MSYILACVTDVLYAISVALKGSSAKTITVALGSESLAVAQLAVDVFVGSLTAADRVQALVARTAFKALFVPRLSPSQHLFGLVDTASASRTALAICGTCNRAWLQHSSVADLARPKGGRTDVEDNSCWLESEARLCIRMLGEVVLFGYSFN